MIRRSLWFTKLAAAAAMLVIASAVAHAQVCSCETLDCTEPAPIAVSPRLCPFGSDEPLFFPEYDFGVLPAPNTTVRIVVGAHGHVDTSQNSLGLLLNGESLTSCPHTCLFRSNVLYDNCAVEEALATDDLMLAADTFNSLVQGQTVHFLVQPDGYVDPFLCAAGTDCPVECNENDDFCLEDFVYCQREACCQALCDAEQPPSYVVLSMIFDDPDCNGNNQQDACEIAQNPALDCNNDGVLDVCELGDPFLNCDVRFGDVVIDACQLANDPSIDCDNNGLIDRCEIAVDWMNDCDDDDVLDACEIADNPLKDCDENGILDCCEVVNDAESCQCGLCNPNCQGPNCIECQPDENHNCRPDQCDGGQCDFDEDCDDGVDCTADHCETGVCVFLPEDALCDDGVECTTDACDAVLGCSNVPQDILCSDQNPCTDDACEALIGCVFAPDDSNTCDDGLFCNGPESCLAGACMALATPCDEGYACDEYFDECSLAGPPSPGIVRAESVLQHGGGNVPLSDQAIDLLANGGIEPRLGGARQFVIEFDDDMDAQFATASGVVLECAGGNPLVADAHLQSARVVVIDLAQPMPHRSCCSIAMPGLRSVDGGHVVDTIEVRSLEGDLLYDGQVTGSDALGIKPRFGQQVGVDLDDPKWDFDRTGWVTGADFLLIKARLGHVAAECDGQVIDCDANGLPDICELDCSALDGACNHSGCGNATDCNQNGRPDHCDVVFRRRSPVFSPFGYNANAVHTFHAVPPAAGAVSITAYAHADLSSDLEYVDVSLNGAPIGRLFEDAVRDCADELETRTIQLNADQYNGLTLGANASIRFTPTVFVDPDFCDGDTSVLIELSYVPADGEPDCNANGAPDECDLATGESFDCNENEVPDECDLANGASQDCNENDLPDECDITNGDEYDCNENSIPDSCDILENQTYVILQPDLENVSCHCGPSCFASPPAAPGFSWIDQGGGRPIHIRTAFHVGVDGHQVDYVHSTFLNGVADAAYANQLENIFCNSSAGMAYELTLNPSSYDRQEYNQFSIPIAEESLGFVPNAQWGEGVYGLVDVTYSLDCNKSGVPDDCELEENDCNVNQVPDECDLADGVSEDCNVNDIPDECDISSGDSDDCNANDIPDECEEDCNDNGVQDDCDIDGGTSEDCDHNAVPDECLQMEDDCNGNQMPDSCDIASGTSEDCTDNGLPDECEPDCNGNQSADSCDIEGGGSGDCNRNEVPDECDIAQGSSEDCDLNGIPDECDPDCNNNEIPDDCDIQSGTSADCNANARPDECDIFDRNSALDFDGGNDRVTVAPSPILEPALEVTVEMWIRPEPTEYSLSHLLRMAWNYGPGYAMTVSNRNIKFAVSGALDGSVAVHDSADIDVYVGEWTHVAGVYSVTQNYCRLYIDGTLKDEQPAVGEIQYNDNGTLFIGGFVNSADDFDGRIDETRIWSVARSQIEIKSSLNCMIPGDTDGLIALWHFNEASGQTLFDATPFGHDGLLGQNNNPNGDDFDPAWVYSPVPPRSGDCNQNGVLDDCEIIDGVSMDADQNGVLDECEQCD